jgi:hypothetical protein
MRTKVIENMKSRISRITTTLTLSPKTWARVTEMSPIGLIATTCANLCRTSKSIRLADGRDDVGNAAGEGLPHGINGTMGEPGTLSDFKKDAPAGCMERLVRFLLLWARPAREWTLAGGY